MQQDANVWRAQRPGAPSHAPQPQYDPTTATPRKCSYGTRGGKLAHLQPIMPDASQTYARAQQQHQQQLSPTISASSTGLHHPSQPGVWAQDAMAGSSPESQQQPAQPATTAGSADPWVRWPAWDKVEQDLRAAGPQ